MTSYVELDISKPIQRYIPVVDEEEDEEEIQQCEVKYERLPYFCFYCGLIGHVNHDCLMNEEDKKIRRPLNTAAGICQSQRRNVSSNSSPCRYRRSKDYSPCPKVAR